jgi:hypothetical protein
VGKFGLLKGTHMATFASIFSPIGGSTASAATADISGALGGTTSTAELLAGQSYQMFAINATGDINIRFGNAGMPAAAATDFRIPANQTATYQLNRNHDRIRIFNPGGTSVNYFIQPMTAAG